MKQASPVESIFPPGFTACPTLIAGPCSAESEEQVLSTARELANQGVRIFRAGVWKPRTRPGSFEGLGTEALPWLRRVKQETGMLVATEVATERHVFEAIKAGVDVLWIGARTTVNAFAMQELAQALRGIENPVLVKNPVSPDLELWIGAVERLEQAGVRKLACIHRGFSHYGISRYRNVPEWQIPLELRRRLPHMPLFCDASHIAGERSLVFEIAQRAMDLSYDGLMLEVHVSPDDALSDAGQQLTPASLRDLMKRLVLRHEEEPDDTFQRQLAEFRRDIDRIDEEVLSLLEQRMRIAESIGALKKVNGVTILQSSRWDQILARVLDLGRRKGLSEECVQRIFKAIHDESIDHQNTIMNERELTREEE